MTSSRPLVVQKYGGATLKDSAHIQQTARQISELAKTHQVIVAVSAMGQTTNELIALAHQVSKHPQQREMDMLLTVGERISMSLLSMAMNDLGCPAISFTGSQAGILTNDSHVNALIVDIKPSRISESLREGKVVIVAGFQGVSPQTKEITTLGRGGTDTTAVALAAHFGAQRCEILKDVDGVYSADPKIVPKAQRLSQLSYESLLEMTFWGAKVLHYRSVELALNKNIPLYIGLAHASTNTKDTGTLISKGSKMFEQTQVLSLNSHEHVLKLQLSKTTSVAHALEQMKSLIKFKELSFPQILGVQEASAHTFDIWLTGPKEQMLILEQQNGASPQVHADFSSVTATASGATSEELLISLFRQMEKAQIPIVQSMHSSMSVTFFVHRQHRERALRALHELL